MSRNQDAAKEAEGVMNMLHQNLTDFWEWTSNGRGVEYQFICNKFQEELYGRRNDYKLFRDELFDRSDSSNKRLSNLYKNFNGGAGLEHDYFLDNIPVEDQDIIRASMLSWNKGDDLFTTSRYATQYIIAELKFWQDMNNDEKKHILKTAKNWYQKSRTKDPNANDYLCAADKLMIGINVGGQIAKGETLDEIAVGGFCTKINKDKYDPVPMLFDYEAPYNGNLDPIQYIEQLEKEIANEEKGMANTNTEIEIKEIPDKFPKTRPSEEDLKKADEIWEKFMKEKGRKILREHTQKQGKKATPKPKPKTRPNEEELKKADEVWKTFMKEKGARILSDIHNVPDPAQNGVSARGLTQQLNDNSQSSATLQQNAQEYSETQEVNKTTAGKDR